VRKLVKFGATMTIILFILGGIMPLFGLIGSAGSGSSGTGILALLILGQAIWDVGYIVLLKKLGAWDDLAWDRMGEGRKMLLFLLTLPGVIGGIWLVIILFLTGYFGEKAAIAAAKSEARAQIRSDIETTVRNEFDRRGY
jgi:hypothetical protein